MENVDEVAKTLTQFIEAQGGINRRLDAAIQGLNGAIQKLKTNVVDLKEVNRSLASMLGGHAQEMRELKTMSKRQERFAEDHERTLRLHYRLIREPKDKDR